MFNDLTLLRLLQLASPVLPVGAYSYSDGLETLVEVGVIKNQNNLLHWLEQELRYGGIRLETAVMVRAYSCASNSDFQSLTYWNAWLSAAKETKELREQSWQMGGSLIGLLVDLEQQRKSPIEKLASAVGYPCNYGVAFGIGAAYWRIELQAAVLGYLHSWASNLIGAAVKLIPLGQTVGQKLLFELNTSLSAAAEEILVLEDEQLSNCGWGLSLASMAHENQYTRLFRS
ncbi:MAG: urease accessory protein UreF [Symploca sp. SIO2E9]|nr:urease accessory protein UreF [Symploca sp. SIO2E9]